MTDRTSQTLLLLLALAATALSTACAGPRTFERARASRATGIAMPKSEQLSDLYVHVPHGRVTITGGSELLTGNIAIRVTAPDQECADSWLGCVEPSTHLVDDDLHISLEIDRRVPRTSVHADLQLVVPPSVTIHVRTVTADVVARGITGEIEMRSVSGRLLQHACTGKLSRNDAREQVAILHSMRRAMVAANTAAPSFGDEPSTPWITAKR